MQYMIGEHLDGIVKTNQAKQIAWTLFNTLADKIIGGSQGHSSYYKGD